MVRLTKTAGLALLLLLGGSCSAGPEASDGGTAADAAAQHQDGSLTGGDAGPVGGDSGAIATGDAGVPDGGPECVSGAPAAPCCDGSGTTMGDAVCVKGAWTCGAYQLCECAGQKLTWECTDVCGSDAWARPTCEATGWACPNGTLRTNTCPAGLCWSEGPQCCSDAGVDWATCMNGVWLCSAGMAPCP
ncbi:MAG TPA: hypothetical protein VGK67_04385 [Myxococcales bacterium]|jgi:hypothetical protein